MGAVTRDETGAGGGRPEEEGSHPPTGAPQVQILQLWVLGHQRLFPRLSIPAEWYSCGFLL